MRWPMLFLSAVVPLAGCNAEPDRAVPLPDPPAPVARPAEYPFGDAVASAENRAANRVAALLGPRFGRQQETHFAAPAGTDFSGLHRWYDERARAAGWRPLEELGGKLGPTEQAFGYQRNGAAFVLLWLERGDGGPVPVTVVRLGD